MCGIVGYIGQKEASSIILEGLEKLEYRGYDSSGMATVHQDRLLTRKFKGRLTELTQNIDEKPLFGKTGIGHTRWATHGEPSDINSHPHTNNQNTLAVVHNGIIENYLTLKQELIEEGYTFVSETDTEVISHLIDYCYTGDLLSAVQAATQRLKGAFALAITSSLHPDELIAVRYESPLILGIGEDEYYIASDIPAFLSRTRNVIYLENGDIVRLTNEGYEIYDSSHLMANREMQEVKWDVDSATKEGYDHFMLKEIDQQPEAVRNTLNSRIDEKGELYLEGVHLTKDTIESFNKVYIVACGTAYHAGLVGKAVLEKALGMNVITDVASEFRYNDNFIDDQTLVIVVSQSGETADTLASLREAKAKGARILSITNVVGSAVARESDDLFYTWAGPEIAVASTKAYTTQLMAFYILALYFEKLKGSMNSETYKAHLNVLQSIDESIQATIDQSMAIAKEIAEEIKDTSSLFYMGRGLDYYTALEASLKLKELSYIHAEAFAAGELKHGTIALIEEGTPVITLATQDDIYEKTVSNIKSVKARGAYAIGITTHKHKDMEHVCDKVIYISEAPSRYMPLISVILTQLIAYYTSLAKGNDVDKPRNLAKSVTVE